MLTNLQRKVKNARVLARIAPEEAAELSWFGSEVGECSFLFPFRFFPLLSPFGWQGTRA